MSSQTRGGAGRGHVPALMPSGSLGRHRARGQAWGRVQPSDGLGPSGRTVWRGRGELGTRSCRAQSREKAAEAQLAEGGEQDGG